MKTHAPRFISVTSLMICLAAVILSPPAQSTEFHVSPRGDDRNEGGAATPFKTISKAAAAAYPGDTITVHEGTYRERISPPRGGGSDEKRIIYQAAPGEKVEIKGSEVVKGWEKVQEGVWKVTLPNTFFGAFNPYNDLIHGDWFNPKDREHHTGAVYLNGEWLIEAATLEEVLAPEGSIPSWLQQDAEECLLNVAWLQPGEDSETSRRIPATAFTAREGTQNAPCEEGGECLGWIRHGHWVKYEKVDFSRQTTQLAIRAASATDGGIIEIHRNTPDGELLGACTVPNTGGWQTWTTFKAKIAPQEGKKDICLLFKNTDLHPMEENIRLWKAQVDQENTTLWAQFKEADPNKELVEINVRKTVFYPDQPGRNYLTVRGFIMRHAATPWAPPTAEQIGLLGTHWSKGWIIENNIISHSICSGIALGKHGDEFDNTSADTAEGYVKTIERALARHWNKETIGHHLVRDNTISFCEQTGIVGSLGCSFSTVAGNTIHDIHVRRLFTGAEMAGIKFHGAIDVQISKNHIYRTCRGIWLDWMAQGARVSQNLFHDNQDQDLFVEVDHGPFLVDNNLFLSKTTLLSVSQGGAYIHNLIAGDLKSNPYDSRQTPYHRAHSTEIAGMHDNPAGDDRYFNNLFIKRGDLRFYEKAALPVKMAGNAFLGGAHPSPQEADATVLSDADPDLKLDTKADAYYLEITLNEGWAGTARRRLVTTEILGAAAIPNLPYEQADGSPLRIDTDYFGNPRNPDHPTPGPFASPAAGRLRINVW